MTRAVPGEAPARLLMALLFLVSASTKVTETAAIQAYMQTYGVPAMLVWPAAAWSMRPACCCWPAGGSGPYRSCWPAGAC
jgi:uncharacterized membrane protein YphA (DoxX/SURF4 family)